MNHGRRFLGWGLVALVAIMPFHAFLSVWAGHLLGHQALWQSWKEVLILMMAGAAVYLIIRQPTLLRRYKNPLGYAIGAFMAIALIVTVFARPGLNAAVFGLKIDIEFLVVFLVALLVASRELTLQLIKALLISSAGVIGFGLLQIFILPQDFLSQFGYGPQTIMPYQVVGSATHMTRIIATLGGANQLGAFLIVPMCLIVALLIRRPHWWHPLFLVGGLVVEWHTYSRSALLGLAAGLAVTAMLSVPKRLRLAAVGSLATIGLIVVLVFAVSPSARSVLYHGGLGTSGVTSDGQHISASQAGLHQAEIHLLGEGLGAAGPASFHGRDPLIPENYYLQLAIETGLAGLVAFVLIQILVGLELLSRHGTSASAAAVLGALIGIGIVNLFLHGWADSSLALVFWAYAGAVLTEAKG